ncbi:hypothetical protein ACFPA8_11365, partial [Streptomyces ovatisporus]
LGVTMYLPRTATQTTLHAIASREKGTTLIADFSRATGELDDHGQQARASAASAVTADKEPLLAAYTTAEVRELLHEAGFHTVTLMESHALQARYLPPHTHPPLSSSTLLTVATT